MRVTNLRIDRLLAITVYLLNRDIITGKELAQKFEVSERTVQRDIETINMAGIPIVSHKGVLGGYQILDTFKVLKQPANKKDIDVLLTALKGLETALEDEDISNTIEKLKSISNENNEIFNFDLSVVNENKNVSKYLKIISDAIISNKKILLEYTNSKGYSSKKELEPVMLKYKWHSWYFIAYKNDKDEYRVYKIPRIKEISILNIKCEKKHLIEEDMFEKIMSKDKREMINIKFELNKSAEHIIREYIPKCSMQKVSEKKLLAEFKTFEEEFYWYSVLFAIGDKINIIEPESLKIRMLNQAKKIVDLNKI